MRSDNYGQLILNTDDAFRALYSGKIKSLDNILFDNTAEIKQFNAAVKENFEHTPLLKIYQEPTDVDSTPIRKTLCFIDFSNTLVLNFTMPLIVF